MLKILMVEDSSTFRKTFGRALRKRFPFMVIEEALDGREALQKTETFVPDLVFMDIRLPGASGLELTRRIKASNAEIVIIILTNYDVPEYRAAAHNGGADAFIPKDSLDLDDIAALIESFFSGSAPDFGRPPEKGPQKNPGGFRPSSQHLTLVSLISSRVELLHGQ